jgi:diamine N-acetyltransferase
MNILEGELVHLRALEPGDIDLLYQWENDPDNWLVSDTLTPMSRQTIKLFIENSRYDLFESRQLRLMIVTNTEGEPVGTIDLFDFDPFHLRAGVGILIQHKKNRNKGYATEALTLLIQYAFSHLDLHQLYCNIASANELSIRLFTKVGFKLVGEKKEWLKENDKFVSELMFQLINHRLSSP